MARLPDRFDLWIRKARECADPGRQVDYVLGALMALSEWHFLNIGTKEKPEPAMAEIEGGQYLLVFSNGERIAEIVGEGREKGDPLPIISMSTTAAMAWCLERRAEDCGGLLVNPGDYAALIPVAQLEGFAAEWKHRGGRLASGFWIPSMTTEEEDFWQEHGA
jgi:hypothetical protein